MKSEILPEHINAAIIGYHRCGASNLEIALLMGMEVLEVKAIIKNYFYGL